MRGVWHPIACFESESHVEFYADNHTDCEADKKRRLGEEGAKPYRLKYKPLTR